MASVSTRTKSRCTSRKHTCPMLRRFRCFHFQRLLLDPLRRSIQTTQYQTRQQILGTGTLKELVVILGVFGSTTHLQHEEHQENGIIEPFLWFKPVAIIGRLLFSVVRILLVRRLGRWRVVRSIPRIRTCAIRVSLRRLAAPLVLVGHDSELRQY